MACFTLKVTASVISEELRVEVLLYWGVDRRQLRWFWHLVRMPSRCLPGEMFWTYLTSRRPQGRPRASDWRNESQKDRLYLLFWGYGDTLEEVAKMLGFQMDRRKWVDGLPKVKVSSKVSIYYGLFSHVYLFIIGLNNWSQTVGSHGSVSSSDAD